jgi:integrase
MLCAIAKQKDLTRTTLRHIKSVLSTIFIYAKNEGAFDGANPVDGAFIPQHAREPGETHAYDLRQVVQILEVLPLLGKSLVATAAFTGLRHGELRGLEWTDYTGDKLAINRSIWKSEVSLPKTRASRDSVPVIRQLAEILDAYRKSIGDPETGVVFHSGDGLPINLDVFKRRVVRPALQAIRVPWYGWHAFRRGLASNLYAMGAQDKVVQRILRHAKPHVTRDCYIKVFDRTLLEAMERLEAQIEALQQGERISQQLKLNFSDCPDKPAIAVRESSISRGFSALLGYQSTSGASLRQN